MPVRYILVCNTGCNIKHNNCTLSLNAISIITIIAIIKVENKQWIKMGVFPFDSKEKIWKG